MAPRIRTALGVAADIIGYRGQKDLRAEGETVLVEHHHVVGLGAGSWVRVVDKVSGQPPRTARSSMASPCAAPCWMAGRRRCRSTA